MVLGGRSGRTFCPSLGRFRLPEVMVSIGCVLVFVDDLIPGGRSYSPAMSYQLVFLMSRRLI